MFDIKFIKEHFEAVKEGAEKKKCAIDFDQLMALDTERRELIQKVEEMKNQQKKANADMVTCKKEKQDFSEKVDQLKELSQHIKDLDAILATVLEKMQTILVTIPNYPARDVPVGGEANNKIIREWGEKKEFLFTPKDHLEVAESLDCIDMPRAAKITGRGFVLYRGFAARLERALINFMLDLHTTHHHYTEISPPFLVNQQSMFGTGQLPKLAEDMYALKDDPYYLIPTAEVPVTNIHRDEVLSEDMLPVRYVAYTPCFRREAGSYGKDTRGLSRVHQFDKVEMVKFVKPEDSEDALESLVGNAEAVLQALGIPYRVVLLASGDLSFAAHKCYDIEIWAPGSHKWFEVSSCSNFYDFQARRANIKFRRASGKKPEYVHTLNGSGVALARLVIAILETYQNEDGTISLPAILDPYMR